MKIWAIFLCLLVLLCGCDANTEIERGMALRSALLQAEHSSMDIRVTADYGEYLFTYICGCSFDDTGEMTFEIKAPDSIAGISGLVSNNQGKILFDDKVVYFELLADGQLSPVSAPWILLNTMKNGYIRSACIEDNKVRLTMDDKFSEDALQVDVWLNGESIPVYAEILYRGSRILSMEIENLVFQ